MEVITRVINNKSYFYLSYYDKDTQKMVNSYCGQTNDPKAIIKAYGSRLSVLQSQQKDLSVEIKKCYDIINNVSRSKVSVELKNEV
ncbi:MAG: hypothetical protein R1F52_06120 [Candidatus Nitrosoabyssus spongiisocia]|nr:MAG: hypothetical protein R1F52_06120 [Nitrosopumilaceae archaeon AB1(1)]